MSEELKLKKIQLFLVFLERNTYVGFNKPRN